jgi:hypothetical protein
LTALATTRPTSDRALNQDERGHKQQQQQRQPLMATYWYCLLIASRGKNKIYTRDYSKPVAIGSRYRPYTHIYHDVNLNLGDQQLVFIIN